MNSFGRIFRVNIFGESHGDFVGVVIDGCPAGISLMRKILQLILKDEKPAQKAQHHEKKMISLK